MPIGSPHLTQAHPRAIEEAALHTIAGMADFADPNASTTCGDCLQWERAPKQKSKGRCRLYRHLMRREGPQIPSTQRACRKYEAKGDE
jgi:hypothetical protein